MKSRILIGVDWFLPAFRAGGPIRSVANLVDLLAAHICAAEVRTEAMREANLRIFQA